MAHTQARIITGCAIALSLIAGGLATTAAQDGSQSGSLVRSAGRITIAGTSNVHAYTAATTSMRLVQMRVVPSLADPNLLDEIARPGAVQAFELAIPAASLTSPREGVDKNMHKALKVTEHPDIVFQLTRLERRPGAPAVFRGTGLLRIAGVERDVTLDVTLAQAGAGLTVSGQLALLMTDYGITPPKALMGMLKTDPKVTVTFETTLSIPLT
jgi:hypothetical protein